MFLQTLGFLALVLRPIKGSYQQPGISTTSQMVVLKNDVNPKPECYQIYQGPMQAPVCATFSQPAMTSGVVPQRTDKSKLSPDLVRLIQSIPGASEKLSSFLEYKGITQPWPEIFDFSSDKRYGLPAPEPMFSKIQSLLNVLEDIKELLSNELFKVETYISRGKGHLCESIKKLRRYDGILKKYLKKISTAKAARSKHNYATKYTEFSEKAHEEAKSYYETKKWLQTIVTLFRSLI
ncbi:hypothetical protein PFJ87_01g00430 [Encephalitozoon hellem]|uniref:Uncharacterized protein n=2 Tax=Encephalitozoon hellem TaxID=27973 RepID=A0ABY8CFZ3_ENCHE|nr:hypothetical protein PFJ87_01g00430 [Encephalitozoon hellem]